MVAKSVTTTGTDRKMEVNIGKYAGRGKIDSWREMCRQSIHKTSILDLRKAY
jgi:hypothetical protein